MKIMRARKSFRVAGKSAGNGRRGFTEGDLVPDSHPLVKRFSSYFEPAEDFVARQYPELCGGKKRSKLFGRAEEPKAETQPPPPGPESSEPAIDSDSEPVRPPSSGPGSGVEAWRAYAAEVTDSPAESWESLTRDEIIELLDSEGADSGQE